MADFIWIEDENARIRCDCGNDDLQISVDYDTICSKCGKIYRLFQETRIIEVQGGDNDSNVSVLRN